MGNDKAGEEAGSSGDNSVKILSELRIQRGTIQGQQTKMKNYIVSKADQMDIFELKTRLSLLEGYLESFNRIQTRIECLDSDEVNADRRKVFEDTYVEIKTNVLRAIHKKTPRTSIALPEGNITLSSRTRSKSLPQLKLTKFSGKYSEWPDFISMFNNLVHLDEDLSEIDKFQHLRSCLSDRALLPISSLEVTGENYESALSLLKKRFENKRLIFQEHISEIFNLRPIERNSLQQLRLLSDSINAHLRALLSIGNKEQIADALLIYIVQGKLDFNTQTKWEDEAPQDVLPTWEELAECIEKRCVALENLEQTRAYSRPKANVACNKQFQIKTRSSTLLSSNIKNACAMCKNNEHAIQNCPEFNALSPLSRFNEAKRLNLCINCLRSGHGVKACKSGRCRLCTFKHHTLLHMAQPSQDHSMLNPHVASTSSSHFVATQFDKEASDLSPNKSSLTTVALFEERSNLNASDNRGSRAHIFLATALIKIKATNGHFVPCRALLDSASQLHFITERLAQQLRLRKTKANLSLNGISNTLATVKNRANVIIKSRFNDFTTSLDVYILPQITQSQPDSFIAADHFKIPENIANSLADPSFNVPQKIDLLIGAGLFFELLTVGQIKLGENLPTLQKTLFGWVVSGPSTRPLSNASCFTITNNQTNDHSDQLDHTLKKFWQLENHESESKSISAEEQECEEHFVRNHKRLASGRYQVCLPFREDPSDLGNSFEIAFKRFLNLESKLKKSPSTFNEYSKFMAEYIQLGHMEPIPFKRLPSRHYFLPHHCVLKPQSSTTQLRVVFDGSCKTSTGQSLNDILMVGPTIQDDLYSILLRFRSHRYAITADITKMYRQVNISDEDSYLQCILWRDNTTQPLQAYRLKTITYGTSSASFLATRCLQQLAHDEGAPFPLGRDTLLTSFYVDDMLAGANTIEQGLQLKEEINHLLNKGEFKLRKWCSNSKKLLATSPETDLERFIQINEDKIIKTLGLIWAPIQDEFRYVFTGYDVQKRITKRTVLSSIARLFDPLGLIGPVILKAKLFMQHLWSLGVAWDESLPSKLETEWIMFYKQLELINTIRIPRHAIDRNSTIEIHGFADASSKAYGACIYAKTIDSLGNHTVYLLTAKSRVAPVKPITIPRLELSAALLLSELLNRVLVALRMNFSKVICWSDSKVVLSWIASSSNVKQPIFVSNRVSKIKGLTENFEWHYVDSHNNPADFISRGLNAAEMLKCSMWFTGPNFLKNKEELLKAPAETIPSQLPSNHRIENSLIVSTGEDLIENCTYKNSFVKLQNVFGYIFRFYKNCRTKKRETSSLLSVSEMDVALKAILRMVQKSSFITEYQELLKKIPIKRNSVLKDLSPFLDDEGLIRVGGRLRHSNLSFDARHQILLPKSHALTKSIISHYHRTNMHAGCQTLLTIIRTKYWPIGGKNTVKQILHSCIRCFRFRPKTLQQIMGDLPIDRVQPSRPFNCTGIDFCGPFFVSHLIRGRNPTKAYICLFICFTTKAVHLEVVSNLTTDAFIAALKRFIARRGKISRIWSDNATNFVGANNKLKELRSLFASNGHHEQIHQMCLQDSIEWKFIPPRSPHFGGLWESSIKSAKHLICRVGSSNIFTLEELSTFACEAEAIINSRPITAISNDPNDLEALTPGHFLVGSPLCSIPEIDRRGDNVNRLTRWQRITYAKQHFWSRWSHEYLQTLQVRHKWRFANKNIVVGSLVIIKDENLPSLKWQLGRILNVHVGEDGHVRVATVRTANGILKRAIAKLCLLPIEDSDGESDHFHGGENVETSPT